MNAAITVHCNKQLPQEIASKLKTGRLTRQNCFLGVNFKCFEEQLLRMRRWFAATINDY